LSKKLNQPPQFFIKISLKIRRFGSWLNSRNPVYKKLAVVALIILVSAVAFSANIAGRSFTSDDVSVQTEIHSLTLSGKHDIFLENDTYVSKMVIYLVFDLFTHPGRSQLILESLLFNAAMVVLLIIWWRSTVPKAANSWLIFTWMLSAGVFWFLQTVNPNTRNYEFGLMILFGFYAVRKLILPAKVCKAWLYIILSGIIAGAITYDDPYFLFFIVVPLFVAVIIYFLPKKMLKAIIAAGTVF